MGYFLTLVGVIFKAVVDTLAGGETGGNAGFVTTLFTVVAVILTLAGIQSSLKTVGKGDSRGKLVILGIHGAIWLVGYFLLKFLIPIVIFLVVACVVLAFLGINPLDLLSGLGDKAEDSDIFTPSQSRGEEPQSQEQVKVWRENGMFKEHLKVNSTGDMYYDPEDGEWHKIEK